MAIVSNTPVLLSKRSQQAILNFNNQCYAMLNQSFNFREQFRQIDLAYIREQDNTQENKRAQIANTYGDANKFQNITVPVVLPQVEAAATYQTSVFLTGTPIFGVVASPGFMDQALQMETVIDYQSTAGGWARQFMLFFRDGFKYNFSAIEVEWCRRVTAAFETDNSFHPTQGKPKEVIWEGNNITRLDPYNTFWDTRVPITEVHERGEFAGYTRLMSRIALKQYIAELPDKMVDNITPAFESGFGGASVGGFSATNIQSYYIPPINPNTGVVANPLATTNWLAWAGMESTIGIGRTIDYKNLYEVTILYARILPSDFGIRVPSANTPQVWKFVLVNHQVIIYAERQTNAHGWIPILFGQPLEDGLSYQTKSLAQNVTPIQQVSSALMNSVIAARRRSITDRVIYDPTRIAEAQINSDNPSAKIPVKPGAYGKPVAEAVYQFPYRDDQSGNDMQAIQGLNTFANIISGHNQAQQGQFVKGNKTLHEYTDVMARANGRDQMGSILLEFQVFMPVKTIIKSNILQYQGGISLYNRSTKQQVTIDPVGLRKAILEFKVSDGLIPSDKLINADAFGSAFQILGSSPGIQAQYNMGDLVSYLLKTQGADVTPFQKSPQQIQYEAAMAQWQQVASMIADNLKGLSMQEAQQLLKQLPPQPKPEDYGLQPQNNNPPTNTPSSTTATGNSNVVPIQGS